MLLPHAKWFSLKRVYDASSGVQNWLGLGQRLPRPTQQEQQQQKTTTTTINWTPVSAQLNSVISPQLASWKCPIGHAFRPNYRHYIYTGGDD